MANVERASYRAFLSEGVSEEGLATAVEGVTREAQALVDEGALLTAAMSRSGRELFLYLEHVFEGGAPDMDAVRSLPCARGWLEGLLQPIPQHTGDVAWAYMFPVFWFDKPQGVGQFARARRPDERCGRIARLLPNKLMEYVTHHQAIVAEGLLVGDRYQFISIHDDMLYSYIEKPRDRERVNIRRLDEPSAEIGRWLDADPASHFDQELAGGHDFVFIDTLMSCGR